MNSILRRLPRWRLHTFSHSSTTTQRSGVFDSYRQCRQLSSYDDFHDREYSSKKKTALVLGSSGCLGRHVVSHLASRLDMKVLGADVVDVSDRSGNMLDDFISIPTWDRHPSVGDVTVAMVQGVSESLGEGEELDAIICASGGWRGDPKPPQPTAIAEEVMQGAREYGESIDQMLEMNLYPILAAGYAANHFMANEGLFVVIGATAALSATPGMLGYGLSKVGAHHFIQTLGETTGKALTTKLKRKQARRLRRDSEYLDTLSVVGILPTTIDTPSNRDAMPNANFDKWTKPLDIAKEIGSWIEQPLLRPHSGSLVKVHPAKDGGAEFNLAR